MFKKISHSPARVKIEDGEELIANVGFDVHKFSDKPKPEGPDGIMIMSCFSEFGCEVVGAMYCIPRIKRDNPGYYVIAMGWYGRAYLYKHLVDEFWELKEEHQWLRDYALAFHFDSHNLSRLEKMAAKMGWLVSSKKLGYIAVGNICKDCGHIWGAIKNVVGCDRCKSENIVKSLFSDVEGWKKEVVRIPPPSKEKLDAADKYLGKNPVGVFARRRKTYGRNLPPEFYVKLISMLEDRGYTPVWLGERQTTLPCPLPHIVDMTGKPESRDLELTLAIVGKLKFTVQFWTASTRLSSITETPFLIVESPEQIIEGNGQEGYRLDLCTTGNKKIALCHYLDMLNDSDKGIAMVEQCIREMESGDWRMRNATHDY